MLTRPTILALLLAAMRLSACAADAAEPVSEPGPAIELGAPFADGAILQRGMKVPVWGWSEPGSVATVDFVGQNQTATAGEVAHDRVCRNAVIGDVWNVAAPQMKLDLAADPKTGQSVAGEGLMKVIDTALETVYPRGGTAVSEGFVNLNQAERTVAKSE